MCIAIGQSAHIGSMDTLSAALAELAARHESSPDQDFDALLAEVKELAGNPATAYEYRHNLGWDNTWLELDEPQLDHVLRMGHPVERRRIVGGWERYTGGRELPEPEFGMFPIDDMAPRPEIPHAERIFAASKDLYSAWERGESWALDLPLHRAYVFFFLETINDAIGELNQRWKEHGMVGEFPDSLAVQDELKRIICIEDKQEAGTCE